MPNWIWLIFIPIAVIGVAAWHRSLLSAIPAIVVCYATYLVAAFNLEVLVVSASWLGLALATLPFVWKKFPGQYDLRKSLQVFLLWPVLITIALLAEDTAHHGSVPEEIPGRLTGTVSFIESAGSEGEHLLVFFDEFGDTAFCCDQEAEITHGMHEGARIESLVECRSVPELSDDDVLWLSDVRLKT